MADDGEELTQEEVDDSLADQGFAAEYGSDRWVADLESEFAATDESESDPAPVVAAGDDDLQAADGESAVPGSDSPLDGYIDLGGTKIPAAEASRVAQFWDWMNQNPNEALEFVGYMTGEYELHPRGQEPTAPAPAAVAPADADDDPYEDWDLLPDSVQERLKKIDSMEAVLRQQQEHQSHQRQQQGLKQVETAQAQFANSYDLSAEQVHRLADEAAKLNIVPALVQETGDPVRAVERALEIVYLQSEQGREREFNRRLAESESAKERQRKMASVGGTAGSVPRQDSDVAPRDAVERRSAMVNEIAAALGRRTD